jgi:uncharacterized protein YnzC (UPF0291/DUF896 family)
MALELTPIIVASITGLGAGIIGSLVAPWAQWKIEEVRERTKERRKFLKSCRTLVSAELEKRDVFNSHITQSVEYSKLREFLSPELIKKIENTTTINTQIGGRGKGINNITPVLLDEINKLEKKWKLI